MEMKKHAIDVDIARMLQVLEPVIDGLRKAGLTDRLFVYGFDEQTDSWAKSFYQTFGTIKKRCPFLRTMAVLD